MKKEKTRVIGFRASHDLYEWLCRMAEREGYTISLLVKRIVEAAQRKGGR